MTILAERKIDRQRTVSRQLVPYFAFRPVPDLDDPLKSSGQQPAIRAKSHRLRVPSRVNGKASLGKNLFLCCQIPNLGASIRPAGSNVTACRMVDNANSCSGVGIGNSLR